MFKKYSFVAYFSEKIIIKPMYILTQIRKHTRDKKCFYIQNLPLSGFVQCFGIKNTFFNRGFPSSPSLISGSNVFVQMRGVYYEKSEMIFDSGLLNFAADFGSIGPWFPIGVLTLKKVAAQKCWGRTLEWGSMGSCRSKASRQRTRQRRLDACHHFIHDSLCN